MNNKNENKEKQIINNKHLIREGLISSLMLVIGVIMTYLLNFKYRPYTNILEYTNFKYWWIVGLVFVIGFILITIICGEHQNKVDGNKVNVATVLKKKSIKTKIEKIYNRLESLVNTLMFLSMLVIGFTLPRLICTVICVASIIIIVIYERKNRFKLVDLFYNFYLIGTIVIITKNILI